MANPPIGNRNISEWHNDIIKSVPALPAAGADLAGFRRFRTSDNTEFICNGTRWLTTQLFEVIILPDGAWALPTTHTTNVTFGKGVPTLSQISPSSEFIIASFETVCATAALYDATHYWQSNMYIQPASGASTEIIANVLRTAAKTTAGMIYSFNVAGPATLYNLTTAVYFGTVLRNNLGGAAAGTLTLYKQSAYIRIVG